MSEQVKKFLTEVNKLMEIHQIRNIELNGKLGEGRIWYWHERTSYEESLPIVLGQPPGGKIGRFGIKSTKVEWL